MSLLRRVNSRAFLTFLLCPVLLSCFPGFGLSAVVTLDSIEIFKTHKWLTAEPRLYFQCKGEIKTVLPDVKKTNVSYTFKGEESWQPLMDLQNEKCKRCGIYAEGILKPGVYDEWEFCPSDFTEPEGRYIHLKDNEFNATFLCSDCVHRETNPNPAFGSHNGMLVLALAITISILVLAVFILGVLAAYMYWKKRKREQEQARFLKLFEESDEIEDELGFGPLDGVIG